MGGIPWWAALIGTPIAAGKMAGGVAETVDSLNKVNDMLDARADKKQYAADLTNFRKDSSYVPTAGSYRDPEKEWKVMQAFQKEAAPSLLSRFKTDYENTTGTSDPRFFGDAESRAELAKNGVTAPSGNPFLAASLADMQKEGEQRQTLKAAMEGNPLARANLAADKDLSSSYHQTEQGFNLAEKRRMDEEKAAQDLIAKDEKAKNLADFQSFIGGIAGPSKTPSGLAQFAKRDGYDIFPGVESDIRQAAAAYNVGDSDEVNKAVTQAREQYERTFLPDGTNLLGKEQNATKEQLYARAAKGDKLAQSMLKKMKEDELEVAKAKRDYVVATTTHGGGKAPAGYRYTVNGDLEPIPGGPASRSKPGKPLPPSAVDFFADSSMMIQTLKEAGEVAPRVNTGPIAGRVQSLLSKADMASDDFVDFQQKIATVNNIMLKARSGAAVTEQEYTRFLKEMPTENDPEKKRMLKLNNAIKYVSDLTDRKRREYQKAGYQIGEDGAAPTKTVVERRKAKSGKILVKYSDGTIGEE